MKDKADILHRPLDRACIEEIAGCDLEPRIGEIDPRTRRPHQHADLMTGIEQRFGDG